MILRNVPFINWDEWMRVKNGLYSQLYLERIHSVEIVSMWRIRGNVPHSVDLTAQLVDLQNQDPFYEQKPAESTPSSSSSSSYLSSTAPASSIHPSQLEHLRLLYSITIIRSVNGIVEPNQTSYFAQSILTIAERLGLPGWIVELRHDATHKQLPSLTVLRAASDYLLNWYQQHYWFPQETLLQSLTESCIPIKLLPQLNKEGGGGGEEVSNDNNHNNHNNTKALNELWYKSLQKNAISSSFLMEIFLPFFTLAVGKIDWKEELSTEGKLDESILQRVINRQLSVWKAPLHSLLPSKDSWIHSSLCRFVLLVIDAITDYRKKVDSFQAKNTIIEGTTFVTPTDQAKMEEEKIELGYNLKIILFWCKYMIELYYLDPTEYIQRASDKRKKRKANANNEERQLQGDTTDISSPNALIQRRKQFIVAIKIRLELLLYPHSNLPHFIEVELLLQLLQCYVNEDNLKSESIGALFQQIEAILNPLTSTNESSAMIVESDSEETSADELSTNIQIQRKRSNVNIDADNQQHPQQEKKQKKSPQESKSIKRHSETSIEESIVVNIKYLQLIDRQNVSSEIATAAETKDNNSETGTSFKRPKKLHNFTQIMKCVDYPVWSLGLLPGRYECDELSKFEEVNP